MIKNLNKYKMIKNQTVNRTNNNNNRQQLNLKH